MDSLNKTNEKIIPIQLIINLIFLIIGIFYVNKTLFLTLTLLNLVLLGTNLIIKKYSLLFYSLAQTNKLAKRLENNLEKFN